jgi:hemolysin activation/secretion protein
MSSPSNPHTNPRQTAQPGAKLGLLALALSGAWSAAAQTAEQASPPASLAAAKAAPPAASFAIKGFEVLGDNPLSQADTTAALAPFLRADASIDTLQKATAALEAALRDHGYGLHRVVLPPQEVGDKLKLNVVKFVIGKVTVEGNKQYSEANIRRSLPELKEGQAPNFKTLAVQTAMANESQGKQIQVAVKEAEEADQINAKIEVKETKPWYIALNLANTGTEATGKDRFTVSGAHLNVFDLDHQFVAAYTTSFQAQNRDDVKQLGLSYRVPLYAWGGVIGASYTKSDVVGNFGAFSSNGAGQTAGINYTHYLVPEGGRRSYLTLALDDKRFDVAQINDVPLPGQLARRTRPLTLGYAARSDTDTTSLTYGADLAYNLSGGDGNDLASYRSEDPRVMTARWKAIHGNASYSASLSGGWFWNVRGAFQYSPDALISGEQFGLGGATTVRGVDERVMSGDTGLQTTAELNTAELAPGLRLLGFVDGGWLRNNNPNANPKPPTDHLASLGLGLRYTVANFAVSADFARIMTGSVLPFVPGSSIPQTGDHKLHVNFSARF